MQIFKKIIFWFLVFIAVIQFIPIDRTKQPIVQKNNFTQLQNTPQNAQKILKNACYDCHSNETIYPNYAYIAPISWVINGHINDGREHLNFSEWGTYNQDLRKNMLTNAVAEIKQKAMPIPGYIVYHPKANLTDAQRTLVANYLENILKKRNF